MRGDYNGDINEKGEAHGYGVLFTLSGYTYKGSFHENKPAGLGTLRNKYGYIFIGEMMEGFSSGKRTIY